MTVDTREITGLVESAVPALGFLGGVIKWLSKQDAKGIAALIGAVLAILSSLGAAIKFLVGYQQKNTKQKKAARERRTAAVSALSAAGHEVLSDLEQDGDMGTAASEADEKLSQPLAEANKLGVAEVTAIGRRISATARQGDRDGLAQALVDLDAFAAPSGCESRMPTSGVI